MSGEAAAEVLAETTEAPAEKQELDFSGRSRAEVIESMFEADDAAILSQEEGAIEQVADEAEKTEKAAEAVAPKDIPGVEEKKAAEKPAEEKVDESEKDASSVEDAPGAGKFRVRSADGSYAPTPDLKFEFQIGDKVYTKDPAALVRMAYDGVAGMKAQAHARNLEQNVIPQIQRDAQATLEQVQKDLRAMTELNYRILSDDTGQKWAEESDKFEKANSPEARAERAEKRVAEAEAAQRQSDDKQLVEYVVVTHIQPIMDRVAKDFPDVSQDTLKGLMLTATLGLQGPDGRIPQSHFPELVRRLNGPFVEGARAEQNRITGIKQAADKREADAKAEAEKKLREAQKKQNAFIAGMKPVGNATAAAEGQEPPRPSTRGMTREQLKEDIINRQ